MMNIRALLLGGLILLTACGSGKVEPGASRLRASAITPAGNFSFDCDPATQPGKALYIGIETTFSCPSTDEKALLTVLTYLDTVTLYAGAREPQPKTTLVVSTVLNVYGPPPATYGGQTILSNYGMTNFLARSLSASFNAILRGDAQISGSFNLYSFK
jgi:hypothetical protein